MNFVRSDWSRTQNVNKRADWLTLFPLVGTDLFYLDNSEYLLIADYYSKYQFVREVPKGQSSSKTIVDMTKQIFSEQGIPQIVRSDNGPHFEGHAYKEFAKQYGFRHITSSPHYARSNGFIESQVKTTKRTMTKAKATIIRSVHGPAMSTGDSNR